MLTHYKRSGVEFREAFAHLSCPGMPDIKAVRLNTALNTYPNTKCSDKNRTCRDLAVSEISNFLKVTETGKKATLMGVLVDGMGWLPFMWRRCTLVR